jgi:hypothetical protein
MAMTITFSGVPTVSGSCTGRTPYNHDWKIRAASEMDTVIALHVTLSVGCVLVLDCVKVKRRNQYKLII